MTSSGLDLFAHWSVCQKLNRDSSVQLCRSVQSIGPTRLKLKELVGGE